MSVSMAGHYHDMFILIQSYVGQHGRPLSRYVYPNPIVITKSLKHYSHGAPHFSRDGFRNVDI